MDWFFKNGAGILIGVVGMLGTIFFVRAVDVRNAKSGRVRLDAMNGGTVMGGLTHLAALGCIGLALFLIITGYPTFEAPGQALPFALCMLAFGGGGIGLWMLSSHRWEWDERGIRWIGVLRSREFLWGDVTAAGHIWVGERFSYLKHRSGHRIWWSENALYPTLIDQAVRAARPDIAEAVQKTRS